MEGDSHSPSSTFVIERDARSGLAKVIPRRPRVSWGLGIALALAFAVLVTPAITADRWLTSLGSGAVELGKPAPLTVRVPVFTGLMTEDQRIGGNGAGVVIARGELATDADVDTADKVNAATPRGPLPYVAFFALVLVFGAIFTHHMRRSTLGRLLRVQAISLISVTLLAITAKVVLLGSAASILIVPVALLAMVPTMVLDRVVGLATGVLAALTLSLIGPFDLGIAILMLVQASTAGLVVAERPRHRWKAALSAGAVTTLLTVGTYVLLSYLTTGKLPPLTTGWSSPLIAAAIGPATAMLLAVPLIPLYQLLVGEITQGKLVELEDLSHPLLRQIAERSPGTWQHSLAMSNMAEIAANSIGANGRLVRVGAYFHDLGKSLHPKYFIENLEPGETSPHDRLPPETSCDAIFAHVTEGIVTARKAGLHERIVDFMHMHHGNGVLEYFWAKTREQGNPNGLTIDQFRYPGHPPQNRETAILAICDAVEAASRTLKKPDAKSIESLVQRIVYGKLHLGQLDESGLSMSDLRRVSDSLRETIRHANHGRIEYPWQKAEQDASAEPPVQSNETSQLLRLDSLDRRPARTGVSMAQQPSQSMSPATPSQSMPIELGPAHRKSDRNLAPDEDLGIIETAPAIGSNPMVKRPSEPAFVQPPVATPPLAAAPPLMSNATIQGPPAGVLSTGSSEVPPVPAMGMGPMRSDPIDEVPAGARPIGPPPDVIGPSTFTGVPPGARAKAATLSPAPRRQSPTLPPLGIKVPTPAKPEPRTSGLATDPAHAKTDVDQRSSGLANNPVPNTTLLGTDAATRRRAPTVPSDPPLTRLAETAVTDPYAWSSTPAEPRRADGPTTLRPDEAPRRPTPRPMVEPAARDNPRTLPHELPLRSPAERPTPKPEYSTRDTLPADRGQQQRTLEADAYREPPRPSDPTMTTLRGPAAPTHLPASAPVPHYPAEPSINPDQSAPSFSPAIPTVTPTRMGGPPEPTDLDAAITNPPPLRRGGGTAPRDIGPARRLPGILLEQDALDHDARLGPSAGDDDVRVTAPRTPVVTPTTLAGHVAPVISAVEDAGRTEPSIPRVELPLRAPPTNPPQDGSWANGLASRIDSAIDDWSLETPVAPPTKAELRALLGAPDPTRQQSLEELERLHAVTRDLKSDPQILPPRNIHTTHEVDPDDIEASIEIAPRARTRSPSAIGVAKPKKP